MIELDHAQPRLLPNEIWLVILTELGASDRRLLYPLLFVSRQTHHLAIPILYEYIRIYLGVNYPESSLPFAKRLHHLHLGLSNEVLVAYTKDFTIEYRFGIELAKSATSTLSQVLGCLVNMRRLQLVILRVPDPVLTGIPLSIALTHLSLSFYYNAKIVRELLESQPSLEFLDLGTVSHSELALSRHALPRLKTFIGHTDLWSDLASDRPVVHLGGRADETTLIGGPASLFHRLSTLEMVCKWVNSFISIAPYLQNIEQLNIRAYGNKIEDTLKALAFLPPAKLRYLRLRYWRPNDDAPDVAPFQPLFESFPFLLLIDVHSRSNSTQMSYRLTRNISVALEVPIPQEQPWECWWESVQDAIEDLGGQPHLSTQSSGNSSY